MVDRETPNTHKKVSSTRLQNVSRRTTLTAVAGIIGGLAGCSDTESASSEDDSDESASSQQESEQSQNQETKSEDHDTNGDTATDQGTETGDSDESVTTATLIVDYEGEWSGSLETENERRSIGGSGPETFEIEGSDDSIMISAEIAKEDESNNTLLVEVIVDDKTVQSSSTNSPSGTVIVTYRRRTS